MKLEKLILINWGFVVSREYSFGDATLLSGSTGVGKSSFQDAIQLVMTGGKQHINVFNSAQDEAGRSGSKVRRTLASYAVGMRDNLCARPGGSHTYVAAVFVPDPGESASAFTVVVAVEAVISGTPEHGRNPQIDHRLFLVLPGSQLLKTDFVSNQEGASVDAVDVRQIINRLRSRYPKVLSFDSIEDYLCKLYAEFRGGGKTQVGPVEAEAAARAFVQSIARKTVGSVDELIREQVLAEPDFSKDIDHIASLMQHVQRLREIATALQASRQRLGSLQEHADAFITAFEAAMEAELGEALRRHFDVKHKIETLQDAQRKALANAEKEKAIEERHNKALGRATSLLAAAQGRLNGNPVAQERERIDGRTKTATEERSRIAVDLLTTLEGLRTTLNELAASTQRPNQKDSAYKAILERTTLELAQIDIVNIREIASRLAEQLRSAQVDMAGSLRDQFAALDAILAPLMSRIHDPEGLYALVILEQARLQTKAATLQEEIKDLKERCQGLEEGRMDLPAHVETAVKFLEMKYPAARPRILCNLVQPRDGTRWQNAIEGLLGGNRFVIFVEEDFEARAIRALRHELPKIARHRKQEDASVVQGELARKRAGQTVPAADSILHELVIADETVRAYLVASYGRYIKVRDEEALRNTASGLTEDGMASGSFKLFTSWAEDGELAFGAKARRNRAVKLAREIGEKEREKNELERKAQELSAWATRLLKLDFAPVIPKLDELAEVQRLLNSLETERASIDDTGLAALERRVVRANQLIEGH